MCSTAEHCGAVSLVVSRDYEGTARTGLVLQGYGKDWTASTAKCGGDEPGPDLTGWLARGLGLGRLPTACGFYRITADASVEASSRYSALHGCVTPFRAICTGSCCLGCMAVCVCVCVCVYHTRS